MRSVIEGRSLAELEEERDHLLRSLEDLDRELAEGDIEEADYDALKEDYTVRAAAVLRAIEDARPNRSQPDPAEPGAPLEGPRPSPRRARLALAALAVLALVAVAGVLVTRSAEERRPGEAATGDIAPTGPTGDVARALETARRLREQGQTLAAIRTYDEVLLRDPKQPEALAYRGWLVRQAGAQSGNAELVDKGLEYVNRAVAADPSYPWAHFFRGLILYEDKRDPAGAVPELRAFLDAGPPPAMVAPIQELLRQAEAAARAGTGPGGSPAPPR
jgi:tetratricopeptide (TPR) repeat protein